MKRAAIDLGTHTCLLLIGEGSEESFRSSSFQVLKDEMQIVKLGEKAHQTGLLQKEAMERTLSCLKSYSKTCAELGISLGDVKAVATSQARETQNAAEFFQEVKNVCGLSFQILSGEEEAHASFKGALLPGDSPSDCAVIDIGGGSTEIVTDRKAVSLPLGAVRLTELFFKQDPVSDTEFWECQDAIDQELSSLEFPKKRWVGVAGSITTLGCLFLNEKNFDREKLDGLTLQRGDIHRLLEDLKWRSHHEKRGLLGKANAGRAEVILAGSLILWRLMEILSIPELKISTRGLRYGALSLDLRVPT